MGFRLRALNLLLRLLVKPLLVRAEDPLSLRRRMDADARFFRQPKGAESADAPVALPRDGTLPAIRVRLGQSRADAALLYLHGGAYIAGSRLTHRHLGAALSGASGLEVLLPEYRLAPEHPLPAALEDALAAYGHLLDAGIAPDRIAVAGESAGGGLSFALLHEIGRLGLPPPACIAAFSPWTDMTRRGGSLERNALRDAMLPASRIDDLIGFCLQGHDPGDPRVSPALGSYAGPPPVLIMASRHEILTDDAVAMAERLREAGGNVRLELWPDVPHAWPMFRGWAPEADRAVEIAGRFIAGHIAD